MAERSPLGVAVIGSAFMGKAHSNAWRNVRAFYPDVPEVRQQVLVARDAEATRDLAARYGWAEAATDWRAVSTATTSTSSTSASPGTSTPRWPSRRSRPASTCWSRSRWPTPSPRPRRCWWPPGPRASAASRRWSASTTAACLPWRWPATWSPSGRLGDVRQVKVSYLQDWLADADAPMTWRLRKETAGSGALGDLASHAVDQVRFLLGHDVVSVSGIDRDLRPPAHGGRRTGGRHGRRRGLGDAAHLGRGRGVARGDADGHRPQELADHRGLRLGRRAGLRPGAAERAVGVHRSRRRLHADAGDRGRAAVRRRVVAAGPRPRLGPHVHQPGRRLPHRDRERRRAVAVVRRRAGRAAGAGGDRGEWGTVRARSTCDRWRSPDGRAVHAVHRPVGRPDPGRGRRAGGRLGLRRPRDRGLRASTSTRGAGTTRTTSPSAARSSTSTGSASGRSPTT